MNQPLPPTYRRVVLRLANASEDKSASLPPEAIDMLLARARALGLPIHHDPQIAAVLAALRLREDVPATLYAAAASVLTSMYEASTAE